MKVDVDLDEEDIIRELRSNTEDESVKILFNIIDGSLMHWEYVRQLTKMLINHLENNSSLDDICSNKK